MTGRVVLLNGASSVGKTSIAAAFQEQASTPWLHLGVDAFLGFVPEPLTHVAASADDGFRWFPASGSDNDVTRIAIGPYGHRVIAGMHRAVAAMARSGLDLIVDDVLLEAAWLDDYLEALDGVDVVFVSVHAPLAVIEARELARGDRFPRQARGHYDHVHHDDVYDVRIDSSESDPLASARTIRARVDAGPGTAFDELRRRRAGGHIPGAEASLA
jgi:chloramphenicol 3-O phosphotransferase